MQTRYFLLFSLLVAILFSSCRNSSKTAQTTSPDNPTSSIALGQDQPGILEIHWRIIEINGSSIDNPGTMNKEAYIQFKADGNQVAGNGGCNILGGTFALSEGNRISFSDIISTKMACPDMEVERKLFEIFEKVETYSVNGDTLTLNGAGMTPLARFVSIH